MSGSFVESIATFDDYLLKLSSLREQLLSQHDTEVARLAQEIQRLRVGWDGDVQSPETPEPKIELAIPSGVLNGNDSRQSSKKSERLPHVSEGLESSVGSEKSGGALPDPSSQEPEAASSPGVSSVIAPSVSLDADTNSSALPPTEAQPWTAEEPLSQSCPDAVEIKINTRFCALMPSEDDETASDSDMSGGEVFCPNDGEKPSITDVQMALRRISEGTVKDCEALPSQQTKSSAPSAPAEPIASSQRGSALALPKSFGGIHRSSTCSAMSVMSTTSELDANAANIFWPNAGKRKQSVVLRQDPHGPLGLNFPRQTTEAATNFFHGYSSHDGQSSAPVPDPISWSASGSMDSSCSRQSRSKDSAEIHRGKAHHDDQAYDLREVWIYFSHLVTCKMSEVAQVPSKRKTARPHQTVARTEGDRSRRHLSWALISFLLLAYDGIMVPVSICFNLSSSLTTDVIALASCCFWTLDVVVVFAMGVMRNRKLLRELGFSSTSIGAWRWTLTRACLRSWLGINVCATGLDWGMICADGFDGDSPWRVAKVARLLRYARLLQLKPFVQDLVLRSSAGLNVTALATVATVLVLIGAHVFACIWHLVGYEIPNGWVHANEMVSMTTLQRYLHSMRWTVGRLQGVTLSIELKTSAEVAIEIVYLFTCLVLVSIYVGIITHAMIVNASNQTYKLRVSAMQYASRHDISRVTYNRMLKHFSAHQATAPAEILRVECSLLTGLPQVLQEDLHYEARFPVANSCQFFADVHAINPRVARQLSYEAMFDLLAADGEVIFASGDACSHMFFITSSGLNYVCKTRSVTPLGSIGSGRITQVSPQMAPDSEAVCEAPKRKSQGGSQVFPDVETFGDAPSSSRAAPLKKGDTLCEAALWTKWEHRGDFVADEDSLCLTLNVIRFSEVIAQHMVTCVVAVKHARACVQSMELMPCDDTTRFKCNLWVDEQLQEKQEKKTDSSDHHVVFISHYKQEAGTEAALMRYALKDIIKSELECPVFVDSEDLTDLARLRRHVEESDALVVLLTPGLLTRPYCVVEIVTAFKREVQIVPVEIQRPGMKFSFPDETFYASLHTGEMFGKQDIKLMKKSGVSARDVEQALKAMFMKIALPYSPHKSENVRSAELLDIMKRIPTKLWDGSEEPGKDFATTWSHASHASKASKHSKFRRSNTTPSGLGIPKRATSSAEIRSQRFSSLTPVNSES